MGYDEQYESWKQARAMVEAPGDFADRVMASIRRSRQRAWRLLLLKMIVAAGRSRILRAGGYVIGTAIFLTRLGSILAIYIPS